MRVHWKLVPDRPPTVERRCPRCNSHKAFESSGKFRINGHGRRLDVWLIYKCSYCENTWNCTILSRVTPESIGKKLLDAFMDNDEATVWRYAFDREMLDRNGAKMALEFDYTVEGEPESIDPAALPEGEPLELAIDIVVPMNHVRTDHFLGSKLGLSRRQLEALFERGALTIEPAIQANLTKKLKRSIVVRLAAGAVPKPALVAVPAEAETDTDDEAEAEADDER